MKVQRTSSNNERQDIEYGAQIEVEGTTIDRYENKYWSRVESLTTDNISPPAREQQTTSCLPSALLVQPSLSSMLPLDNDWQETATLGQISCVSKLWYVHSPM